MLAAGDPPPLAPATIAILIIAATPTATPNVPILRVPRAFTVLSWPAAEPAGLRKTLPVPVFILLGDLGLGFLGENRLWNLDDHESNQRRAQKGA